MLDPARRLLHQLHQLHVRCLRSTDTGQTTAEYALVILAAGALALAAIVWARSSGSITGLFQEVVDRLTDDV
jgi:hypothetical protein